jgi:DUF4097 and DUF4098 domain-containing protein YvlB
MKFHASCSVALLSAALLANHGVYAYCSEEKTINHEMPAGDFSEVRLNALAGDLILEGTDSNVIRIEGQACTDRTTYLDRMEIAVEADDKVLELSAIIPYHESDWHADYAYIDITLEVPKQMLLLVKDSSGDLEGYGVRLAQLIDSSGDIRLRETSGNLSLRDSAGYVRIDDHRGNLELEDSSGDLEIENLTGDLTIVRDSSGDIEVETVSGFVTVERDSSGDIEIETVRSDVTIGSDGSGSITIKDVEGSVEIGSDGSGDINVQRVAGNFVLQRKGSGDIRTASIGGNVSIPEYR